MSDNFRRNFVSVDFSCLPAVEQAGWLLPTPRDSSMEKMNENINFIETLINLIALKHFSIQFSIENHLPSKERRQARSDK